MDVLCRVWVSETRLMKRCCEDGGVEALNYWEIQNICLAYLCFYPRISLLKTVCGGSAVFVFLEPDLFSWIWNQTVIFHTDGRLSGSDEGASDTLRTRWEVERMFYESRLISTSVHLSWKHIIFKFKPSSPSWPSDLVPEFGSWRWAKHGCSWCLPQERPSPHWPTSRTSFSSLTASVERPGRRVVQSGDVSLISTLSLF